MKILFDHPSLFALAHGGFQIQIEQTKTALEAIGVEVEFVRWWDEKQTGDLIHYFGRPGVPYIELAQRKGTRVVVAELHSALGSRTPRARAMQKIVMRMARRALPTSFTARLAWDAYLRADGFIANTAFEARLMRDMFDADPAKIHVVPNGVEEVFFRPHIGGRFLVCTAAIHPRKRVLELAAAAAEARVPLWIVGRPYAETDPYHRAFLEVQRRHAEIIRYEGPIADRARLAEVYAAARGFVLVSTEETLSLSSFEAAAAGCPLLLSDLPWARETFAEQADYVSASASTAPLGVALRDFYERAPARLATFRPAPWTEIAREFRRIYAAVLARPTSS